MLSIVKNDEWLKPFENKIEERHHYILEKEKELLSGRSTSLVDFANGHNYFGLHKDIKNNQWIFREWAPNASSIYFIGDFNNWKKNDNYQLHELGNGIWEIKLPLNRLKHLDLYKLIVCWENGEGERIPSYAYRVIQDTTTYLYSAQVWDPTSPYKFKNTQFKPNTDPLLIYECHIGMASKEEKVATFKEFQENILPIVKDLGYNAIQIMAIQEHPYYGSFGYHVSSFFAASSRFGTPDDLKELIDTAHSMGIAVIMDIVHSHAVKNEQEGLGRFDGTYYQYFHEGSRGLHQQWDSYCFNYGKNEVLHFLLSNCKFWLEEYHFDGFRFDGVTSMLYYDHGLERAFTSYSDYFSGNEDIEAIGYLALANKLIHQLKPTAITIAEEMSGMPGLALPIKDGGYGFDYRMALNIPDFWIKLIKEKKDEDWHPSAISWELTNRRKDEKTISYAESHDQALVGDKTIIFRLIDAEMYTHMSKLMETSLVTDRGIALHKMIRLVTISTINGGYLNFMGNEFGHPEWVDFPREGNNWSYKYAKRQWNLIEDKDLKYHWLYDFDKAMIKLLHLIPHFPICPVELLWDDNETQILGYKRDKYLFIFNFNPNHSFNNHKILAPSGKYIMRLSTDDEVFGGQNLIDPQIEHLTQYDALYEKENKGWLYLYIPARTAFVLEKID